MHVIIIIYTLPLTNVIKQYPNINYFMYADYIQLYWKYELTWCARNVIKWRILNTNIPNSSKTKLLNITRKHLFSIILLLILLLSFQFILLNLFGVILDYKL